MPKTTLRQLAYKQIRVWIADGQLPKGSVTSEGSLSERLEMSRTPIRAALQQLELEGFVRIVSKHGILILDTSSERVADLLDLIGALLLYTATSANHSQAQSLQQYTHKQTQVFAALIDSGQQDESTSIQWAQTCSNFEYRCLVDWISFSRNLEMSRQFELLAARLFWPHNLRRWLSPHSADTLVRFQRLLDSLGKNDETLPSALIAYVQTLKRTWS